MDRRSFLKYCSLLASGAGAPHLFAHAPATSSSEQFSLNLITADSERAIPALEELVQAAFPIAKQVKFAEYPLAGQHLGDLVLIKNRKLIDYRNTPEALGLQARALVKSLELPRVLENPVLVKFYTTAQNAQPENVNVFVNNVLVKQLTLAGQAGTHEIIGVQGRMAIAIRNGSVKVAGAACQHKTCMKMGAINSPGQHLVCIPNAVRIAIEGHHDSRIDGITF